MSSGRQADCGCGRGFRATSGSSRRLGLDELMIVNPGPNRAAGMLLGEDGAAYRVEGLAETDATRELGRFFLGEDGTLYRADELHRGGSVKRHACSGKGARREQTHELRGYFLGADGTLYQVVG